MLTQARTVLSRNDQNKTGFRYRVEGIEGLWLKEYKR